MMNARFFASRSLVLALLVFNSIAYATLPMAAASGDVPSLAPMLKEVMPSIVNITIVRKVHTVIDTSSPQPQPKTQNNLSLGSGVIVDAKQGYILTNNHLVRNAQSISVNLSDGHKIKAKLIGADAPSDLAVLQITADKLQAIRFGDSAKVQVGDFVTTIGNPFGFSQTVTSGIVSALGRNNISPDGQQGYENFIQTDAPINPGNSGGALVNMQGELIGINTAIFALNGGNLGIGFAIPSNMARSIMVQLIKYGRMQRGMLGILVQNVSDELATAMNIQVKEGAIVSHVSSYSPADAAGLKVGDLIYSVNHTKIEDATMVRNIIGLLRYGSVIQLNIIRQGKHQIISVRSADPKVVEQKLRQDDKFLFGVALQPFDQERPLLGRVHGVQVVSILENTPSWRAQLLPGDVILSVDQQPVTSISELRQIVNESKKKYLLLHVQRNQSGLFIPIKSYIDHIAADSEDTKSQDEDEDDA
jgi:serine protease Do